jgi:hypothetical protein
MMSFYYATLILIKIERNTSIATLSMIIAISIYLFQSKLQVKMVWWYKHYIQYKKQRGTICSFFPCQCGTLI